MFTSHVHAYTQVLEKGNNISYTDTKNRTAELQERYLFTSNCVHKSGMHGYGPPRGERHIERANASKPRSTHHLYTRSSGPIYRRGCGAATAVPYKSMRRAVTFPTSNLLCMIHNIAH